MQIFMSMLLLSMIFFYNHLESNRSLSLILSVILYSILLFYYEISYAFVVIYPILALTGYRLRDLRLALQRSSFFGKLPVWYFIQHNSAKLCCTGWRWI